MPRMARADVGLSVRRPSDMARVQCAHAPDSGGTTIVPMERIQVMTFRYRILSLLLALAAVAAIVGAPDVLPFK